jgi:hypothetical protein
MLGIIIGAGILGVIISIVEREGFPGWGKMVICALAAGIPAFVLSRVLPNEIYFLPIPLIVSALCAMGAIMVTVGTTIKRAAISAGIYLAVQLVIGILFAVIFAK